RPASDRDARARPPLGHLPRPRPPRPPAHRARVWTGHGGELPRPPAVRLLLPARPPPRPSGPPRGASPGARAGAVDPRPGGGRAAVAERVPSRLGGALPGRHRPP